MNGSMSMIIFILTIAISDYDIASFEHRCIPGLKYECRYLWFIFYRAQFRG